MSVRYFGPGVIKEPAPDYHCVGCGGGRAMASVRKVTQWTTSAPTVAGLQTTSTPSGVQHNGQDSTAKSAMTATSSKPLPDRRRSDGRFRSVWRLRLWCRVTAARSVARCGW